MKKEPNIPSFDVDFPFEILYRNSMAKSPVVPHTHNALEIYFTLTDLPDVLLNDTLSSVKTGSLIIIPPHYVHQLFHEKDTMYERYIITVNSSWLTSVLSMSNGLMSYAHSSSQPAIVNLTDSEIEMVKEKLNLFLSTVRPCSMEEYSEFFSILCTLDRLITSGLEAKNAGVLSISQSQKRVNEIISFINSHLTEPLTVETIASEFHLNKDYLGRLFKKHTQATIGHFISVQRASLAQNMLMNGLTVNEVSNNLGFSSYAYFFKFFKKMTGISPSHFRKTI